MNGPGNKIGCKNGGMPPWNDCKGKEKERLRTRFDAIVATHHDPGLSELETTLDRIGVGLRR